MRDFIWYLPRYALLEDGSGRLESNIHDAKDDSTLHDGHHG